MEERPTVWIPKSAGHSFAAAEAYGVLRFMFDETVSPFNLDLLREELYRILEQAKQEDFLLPSGNTVLNMLTLYEWSMRFDVCNLLLFHVRERKYIKRKLNFKEWADYNKQ